MPAPLINVYGMSVPSSQISSNLNTFYKKLNEGENKHKEEFIKT